MWCLILVKRNGYVNVKMLVSAVRHRCKQAFGTGIAYKTYVPYRPSVSQFVRKPDTEAAFDGQEVCPCVR